MAEAFSFSPRPNRAHEINWQPWTSHTFSRARAENRLILLDISGVWCHWCHVMDETTYSDPQVINLINRDFIAIRVDTDERPDINERYNLGGWPTTAVLDPAGALITGATYVPPREMRHWLEKVAELWQTNPEQIREVADEYRQWLHSDQPDTAGPVEVRWEVFEETVEAVLAAYDPIYGGFGREPKFPLPDALELLAVSYADRVDDRSLEALEKTLRGMAEGGMYDPVEGGFFRYSTTRDWTIPHFEKMLEDNARLIDIYLLAAQLTGDTYYSDVALDVLSCAENTWLLENGGWAGTQDADEEYYTLGPAERRKREAPSVDRTVYVEWNALMVRALLRAGAVLHDRHWFNLGRQTLALLMTRAYDPNRGMAHALNNGSPSHWGFLADQAATGRALTMAFQVTGYEQYLSLARDLAHWILQSLGSEHGAFYDLIPNPKAVGALAVPMVNQEHNARTVRFLLELWGLTEDDAYREAGRRALAYHSRRYRSYGHHAGAYALASYEAVKAWTRVSIIGSREAANVHNLVSCALTSPRWPKTVTLLDAGEQRERIIDRGYQSRPEPTAYVCVGRQCLAPVTDCQELQELLARRITGVSIQPKVHCPDVR